jgi:hypothetical protein
LYFSPNIIKIIMSRRRGWTRHNLHGADETDAYKILVGNPEGET